MNTQLLKSLVTDNLIVDQQFPKKIYGLFLDSKRIKAISGKYVWKSEDSARRAFVNTWAYLKRSLSSSMSFQEDVDYIQSLNYKQIMKICNIEIREVGEVYE